MRHPELLLIPGLMLADYGLTVLSARLGRARGAQLHLLELNPVLHADLHGGRWLSARHLAGTAFVALALWGVSGPLAAPAALLDALLGAGLAFFGALVGSHVANLLILREVRRRPEGADGALRLSHEKALVFSMHQLWALTTPLALITLLRPSPFLVGALAGVALLALAHVAWIRAHRCGAGGETHA